MLYINRVLPMQIIRVVLRIGSYIGTKIKEIHFV